MNTHFYENFIFAEQRWSHRLLTQLLQRSIICGGAPERWGGVLALRRNPFFHYPIVNVQIQMPNSHNKRSFGIITRLGAVMFNSSMPMITKIIITKTVLLRINFPLKLIP